jgi:hypothetical protein
LSMSASSDRDFMMRKKSMSSIVIGGEEQNDLIGIYWTL